MLVMEETAARFQSPVLSIIGQTHLYWYLYFCLLVYYFGMLTHRSDFSDCGTAWRDSVLVLQTIPEMEVFGRHRCIRCSDVGSASTYSGVLDGRALVRCTTVALLCGVRGEARSCVYIFDELVSLV